MLFDVLALLCILAHPFLAECSLPIFLIPYTQSSCSPGQNTEKFRCILVIEECERSVFAGRIGVGRRALAAHWRGEKEEAQERGGEEGGEQGY